MASDTLKLTAANSPAKELAFTNIAYVHPDVFKQLGAYASSNSKSSEGAIRCEIKHMVFNVLDDGRIKKSEIGLNKTHRMSARISLDDSVLVKTWDPEEPLALLMAGAIECELGLLIRNQSATVKAEELEENMRKAFHNQIFTTGQTAVIQNPSDNAILSFNIKSIKGLGLSGANAKDKGHASSSLYRGAINANTEFSFSVADGFSITLSSSHTQHKNLFRPDFDFQQLGIGGLDKEFADIFRRAFASRIFPPHIIAELGIQHVRGMLLYGPPGTGKTLIARQIGQALRAREPKIVNGPEVLNKYVGQSEENIRVLFKEAEDEYKKKGDNSSLHIIIFDEIDAICKQRGSAPSGAGVSDSIVNQLLSKIDGVDSLNNILLIGMTNRLDMIDEALLRPGRLEVHMEIGLPDAEGRAQILRIHTARMREAGRLAADVSLTDMAERTKNFSGAEIAGLIRSATSYAFTRQVDVKELTKPVDVNRIQICQADFECALEEVKPAFGVQEDELSACVANGIIDYSNEFKKLRASLLTFAHQVRDSPRTPLLSALLVGKPGSGKTALAAHIATLAEFPFVKLISPEGFVGSTEHARISAIKTTFEDAYKSKLSIVLLDCVERLMDYTSFGNRFSNPILQALLVLTKKAPKKEGHKLLILATSSEPAFMEECGLGEAFHVVVKVPLLVATSVIKVALQAASQPRNDFAESEIDQVCRKLSHPLGIKQLLLVYEMASESSKGANVTAEKFLDCLRIYGL